MPFVARFVGAGRQLVRPRVPRRGCAARIFAIRTAKAAMTLAKLKAYGQLLAAALVAMIGLSVAGTAIGHAFDPDHIGLWSGQYAFFFGGVYGRLDGLKRPPR
jgi:hypothetical protein